MTSVDACGITFLFKHNYLPFLASVLNLQIGFVSPKNTVNFFHIKIFMAVIRLRVIADMIYIHPLC